MHTGSIYKYADVGLVHFMAYPQCSKGEGPILETLAEICRDDYFTMVEIAWMKDPEVRKAARSMIRRAGLRGAYGAHPTILSQKLNLNDPDEATRKEAVRQMKAGVDEAAEMECGAFAFLSGKDPGDYDRAKGMELLYESVCEICDHAKNKNLGIALEVFDRAPFGKNALIGPTLESVTFAEKVRSKYRNFGLLQDLGHMPLLGETAREMLEASKDVLVHVHIGNCVISDPTHPAYGDEHPCFGVEGGVNGVDELTEFLEVLFKIGYFDGLIPKPLSFEIKPMAAFAETTDLMVANAKRTLNKAWAQL